ncbi:MAG TPA: aspartyl/asparaginyl beta-hydroxylase domain-containing protein [Solirubrobacteraceae bacterium]|nr:aspartyl/asparaginyl beta-hydroxylase domain-containing protein [Solirubrobacteraceae bacterium]
MAAAIIRRLAAEGAAQHAHRGEATLLDHLIGTYEIMRRWHQPEPLQHAALLHSVYGTDVYRPRLLPPGRRGELRAIAGADAERLAYLFSVTPRGPLLAGTHRWAHDLPRRDHRDDLAGEDRPAEDPPAEDRPAEDRPAEDPPAEGAEVDALVLLHMANLAEQGRAPDGSPARWLVRLRDLAEPLIRNDAVNLPAFIAGLAAVGEADEALAIDAYRQAVAEPDAAARADRLALAAAACPVVAEPCLWLAHLALVRGDVATARDWARQGQRRLLVLGTAWDKRLTFDEWLALAQRLANPDDGALVAGGRASERVRTAPGPSAGRQRFHRYVEAVATAGGLLGVYPELESRPWLDPSGFPLVSYLESHAEVIREEITALEPRFQRESERIRRAGDWDVVFLYERGRRHDDVCDACPVTTRGIESHATMRTASGLIYASRMRAGTHIHPHRGPTNLRVRCHLGLTVPDGDCAIRVGDETRRWTAGKCLVFDDFFEHEAWNHTDADRIVLIVDLWHPGLSDEEVRLLEGLHGYTLRYARQLHRYWSANARAAAQPPARDD